MPSVSPTASLRSTESSVSSCSDISVDTNFDDRVYVEDSSTDSGQEDSDALSKGHLDDSNLPVKLNGFHHISSLVKHDSGEVRNVDNFRSIRNAESVGTFEVQEADKSTERVSSSVEISGISLSNNELDAEFWLPPEPEDEEDDIIGSVANYDDDEDECGDGVSWSKPSSLSSFGEEGSGSYKFKEEKLKAMNNVRNGKFMALVSQLIKSVGVDCSGNSGENWVDIVTSLSWEAAAFLKPDTHEGQMMDPDGYVKVKCIATGLRTQSQVIKGLVFKKHAAHKHMPTKYKNPRLLLIHGSLDLSSGGLSSFESMQQEKDSLKLIIEMIEMCHPNVILVEKSVSRDIQESILAKGITLVYDMKLHRLERVARCIGSPLLSAEIAIGKKLRQCDSFRIEKFVEEHAVAGEGGKRPSKTLLFLEGSPTRLGCTVLLMGANSNELKRIKCVVRCAVVMAYHLMLETSFLLDQSAMFSTISSTEVDLAFTNKQLTPVGTDETNVKGQKESDAEINESFTLDVPASNGFHRMGSQNLIASSGDNSSLSFQSLNLETFPGLSHSTSIQELTNDSFPLFSDSSESMPSALRFDGRNQVGQAENEIHISSARGLEVVDHHDDRPKAKLEENNLLGNEQSNRPECSDTWSHCDSLEDHMLGKDEISTVLDSESILVLMSSRNASRGTMCEQSHFSHIKFYRSFDVPLGKFLCHNLLNQKLQCKTCGESTEVHFFYYAHHNKQLTIQVCHLPSRKSLPGESEGKLWMWSRCGQCKFRDGSSKSTKRVLMSAAARGLSFGKFLELSFSNHSSFNSPSSCGHSLHKDFIYFFGLGPMVAMFKYSAVATYSVSLPPQKMEVNSKVRGEFLKKDSEHVYSKGISMFSDIEKSLKDIGSRYVGVTLNIHGSSKQFSDIVEMLKQEKSQFEVDIQNVSKNESEDDAVRKLLSLNRVRLELLLESCVWDRRLHALLSSDLKMVNTDSMGSEAQENLLRDNVIDEQEFGKANISVGNCDSAPENSSGSEIKRAASVEANDFPIKEIQIDGQVEESRGHKSWSTSCGTNDVARPNIGGWNENGLAVHEFLVGQNSEDHSDAVEGNSLHDTIFSSVEVQMGKETSIATDMEDAGSDSNHSPREKHHHSLFSNLENDKGWIWAPFTDIRREYMEDLQRGYLPKIVSFSSYAAESMAQKLITDEGSRLHIPLGNHDYIVSDYEDEFSSIIACALTLVKDVAIATEDLAEDAPKERANESSQSLTRVFSFNAPNWSSLSSLDSDGMHSPPANLTHSHSSSFDGLDLLDSFVSYGASHPEVSMGLGKYQAKRKYSVVCLYASQFRQLRARCCPSEVDYIASLSRCRNWDAKGGKSKSFFAITLDDRFIIKEIKRTEFDSFMKFATNYFDYMNQCYELGNQTCLAKILGIYQVAIKATKNGKETRHDLLVMENLSFGRHIARQYDLKGALHARFNSAGNNSGDVLLDQNFVNDMNVSPLYVSRKSKRNLQRAIYNDTNFLNSINVMDYSLLVGVDSQRRELACGIIDYLRQYTWDKQLENWVKSSLVVPKNQLPTIISPKEYKKRFRKFINTHFLSVPDHWCSQRSSNPCKLCGPALENGSLHKKSQKRGNQDDDSAHGTSQKQGKHDDGSSHGISQKQGKHDDGSLKSPHHGRHNGFFA
ncbi:putative 1-phosphatidylinositol-3-phosphate 5-kinase FAB1D [Sesamum indicum]|uniref:1-phosphatidylinositol-3-phosphate 5-kinase n=1 Tax=Sesamum indicum TaxID=4182 RepID=A0A6I9T3N2_SESIN|nr:putative 1-phosphatidylinositol-3-phosphate 5-kinase FAB1D [Sesamum indicum]